MRRRLIVFSLVLCLMNAVIFAAAKCVVQGSVVLQNSKGKPVPGAKITVYGVKPVMTDTRGQFKLKIPINTPGAMATLVVEKPGLEVVNPPELEILLDEKITPLVKIVMCQEGERSKKAFTYTEKYLEIANKYEKGQSKEQSQEPDKQKDETVSFKALELLDPKKPFNKEFLENFMKTRMVFEMDDEIGERFSRVNLDDVPPLYVEAFDLFTKGDCVKALEILTDEEIASAAGASVTQQVECYLLKARLLLASLQVKEAAQYYARALQAAPDNIENTIEVCRFILAQGAPSLPIAGNLINKTFTNAKLDSQKARISIVLGEYFVGMRKIKEASMVFQKTIAVFEKLAEKAPQVYLSEVAHHLEKITDPGNIGLKPEDQLPFFEKKQEIYKKLSADNPQLYLPNLVYSLNSLARCYLSLKQNEKNLESYKEALSVAEKLAGPEPGKYLVNVADILENMGEVSQKMQRKEESKSYYEKALQVYQQLVNQGSLRFLNNMMVINFNIAEIYQKDNLPSSAIPYYKKAAEFGKRSIAEQGAEVSSSYVGTLWNLGLSYWEIGKKMDALSAYEEALKGARQLAQKTPRLYLGKVSALLSRTAHIYRYLHKFNEAAARYREIIEITDKLMKEKPLPGEPGSKELTIYLAGVICNLAEAYRTMEQFNDAVPLFKRALDIYQQLEEKDPGKHELRLCVVSIALADVYSKIMKKEPGKSYKKEALTLINRAITIAKKYPQEEQARKYLEAAEYWKKYYETGL